MKVTKEYIGKIKFADGSLLTTVKATSKKVAEYYLKSRVRDFRGATNPVLTVVSSWLEKWELTEEIQVPHD